MHFAAKKCSGCGSEVVGVLFEVDQCDFVRDREQFLICQWTSDLGIVCMRIEPLFSCPPCLVHRHCPLVFGLHVQGWVIHPGQRWMQNQ